MGEPTLLGPESWTVVIIAWLVASVILGGFVAPPLDS